MDRKTRNKLKLLRSKKFGSPAVVGLREDASGAMRLGRNQINRFNDFAQSVGCGRPAGADGKPVWNRNIQKKYLKARNERAADLGEPPVVNFDGGYGDET